MAGHAIWHLLVNKTPYMLTFILIAAGLAGFGLFYKFIDWFEKI